LIPFFQGDLTKNSCKRTCGGIFPPLIFFRGLSPLTSYIKNFPREASTTEGRDRVPPIAFLLYSTNNFDFRVFSLFLVKTVLCFGSTILVLFCRELSLVRTYFIFCSETLPRNFLLSLCVPMDPFIFFFPGSSLFGTIFSYLSSTRRALTSPCFQICACSLALLLVFLRHFLEFFFATASYARSRPARDWALYYLPRRRVFRFSVQIFRPKENLFL